MEIFLFFVPPQKWLCTAKFVAKRIPVPAKLGVSHQHQKLPEIITRSRISPVSYLVPAAWLLCLSQFSKTPPIFRHNAATIIAVFA